MVQERPSDSTRPPAQGRRLGGGAIASLSGVGLLVIFMVQITQRVRLDFLFWTFTWPLWLLTMASALLGALVWLGLGVVRRHRRRKERRRARRGGRSTSARRRAGPSPRCRAQIPQLHPYKSAGQNALARSR